MQWQREDTQLSGDLIYLDQGTGGCADGGIYILDRDRTIRRNDGYCTTYADETLLAGPFDSLDAAKAAYLVMVG